MIGAVVRIETPNSNGKYAYSTIRANSSEDFKTQIFKLCGGALVEYSGDCDFKIIEYIDDSKESANDSLAAWYEKYYSMSLQTSLDIQDKCKILRTILGMLSESELKPNSPVRHFIIANYPNELNIWLKIGFIIDLIGAKGIAESLTFRFSNS